MNDGYADYLEHKCDALEEENAALEEENERLNNGWQEANHKVRELQTEIAALRSQEPVWWHHVSNGQDIFLNIPFGCADETALFTAPQPAAVSDDAKDAARFRFLLEHCVEEGHDGDLQISFRCDFNNYNDVRKAIDAAMKESK